MIEEKQRHAHSGVGAVVVAETTYCYYYPQNTTFYYLYQRYPNFPNLAVEVRHPRAATS